MTVGSQMPELDRGVLPTPYKLGSQNTPYKLGLRFRNHNPFVFQISGD